MDDLPDYYQLLGLDPDASPEEIKQAYRDLANVWHPDRFLNNPRLQQKANERMKEINQAYEMLKDTGIHSGYAKRERKRHSYRDENNHKDEFDPSGRILCSDGTCIGVVNEKGFCKVCGKPYRPESQTTKNGRRETAYDDSREEAFDPSGRILCSDGTCIGVVNEKGFCKVCGKPYRPGFS
jgi:curved DNA-binding protein CbpA